jgi:hypothetical protein
VFILYAGKTRCILKYLRLNLSDKAENRAESDRNLMAPVCAGVAYKASGFMWLSEGDSECACYSVVSPNTCFHALTSKHNFKSGPGLKGSARYQSRITIWVSCFAVA